MNNMYTEQEYKDLLKRYDGSQETLRILTEKLNKIEQLNNILNAEKKQWEGDKVNQSEIIQLQLQNSDNVVRKPIPVRSPHFNVPYKIGFNIKPTVPAERGAR